MDVDVMANGGPLRDVQGLARHTRQAGFSGMTFTEAGRTAYLSVAAAALAADVPVYVSAVDPWMVRMAGEVTDGIHVHPLHSERYISELLLPGVAAGAGRVGKVPASGCPS